MDTIIIYRNDPKSEMKGKREAKKGRKDQPDSAGGTRDNGKDRRKLKFVPKRFSEMADQPLIKKEDKKPVKNPVVKKKKQAGQKKK